MHSIRLAAGTREARLRQKFPMAIALDDAQCQAALDVRPDLGSSAVVPFVMLVIMRCALALPRFAYMCAYTDSRIG